MVGVRDGHQLTKLAMPRSANHFAVKPESLVELDVTSRVDHARPYCSDLEAPNALNDSLRDRPHTSFR